MTIETTETTETTDGTNLVTMAMNGWADAEPAWWLNLQANPNAVVELPEGTRSGPRPRRDARRAAPPLGAIGVLRRRQARRLRLAPLSRDGRGHPEAALESHIAAVGRWSAVTS